MNILLVNYEYPPIGGGAGSAAYFLARALARQGHVVRVLSSGFAGLRGWSEEDGIRVLRISSPRKAADRSGAMEKAAFTLRALFSLRGLVARERPDGAIVFFAIPCGPIGLLLKKLWSVPYIVSLRGGDVPGLVPELAFAHRLLTPLRRLVHGCADAVIANSEGLAGLSRRADPAAVRVVPNGVDSEYFKPAPSPGKRDESTTRFLFVGRCHDQKNLFFLLEALARLAGEGGRAFEAHFAGDGPLRGELEARAAALGIARLLRWHGWCSKSALLDLYRKCHCFVNPSHYEGMPNTVLEAMACGLPVVASRIPGNTELVGEGRAGLLFDIGDLQGLLGCLRRMAASPSERESWGAQGRRFVEESFSWDMVAREYLASFRR